MLHRLFIFSVVISFAAAACTDEQLKNVDACYTTYLLSYGLPTKPLLPYFWTTHDARTALTTMGQENQHILRDRARQLGDCMAPYTPCMDREIYMTRYGQNHTEAGFYLQDLVVGNYQFSDRGYQLLLRHFYCMNHCEDTQDAALEKCEKDFEEGRKNNDPNACNAHIACINAVFTGCCGPEGGEFKCNTAYQEDHTMLDLCKNMNLCPTAP